MDGIRMVLVGPNAGKDIELGGFRFEEGELILPSRGSEHAQRLLTRYYSAYPEGSLEGREAHRAWLASQGETPSARGASSAVSARDVENLQAQLEAAHRERESLLERARREREDLEAKLARAEAKAKAGATAGATENSAKGAPATEVPAGDTKAPKPAKSKAE
ncbi:hypothetical protein HMI49_03825 [Corallococcus exercitus]|uniref:Uncharacterized protein n=1 Tax=Corallococcus exercitus TaxID=2316736 RepID=A0A7Y4NPB3_9BACT|nr:hypothetical protein [Corallococcus exercitus]NOK32330.1 hypothetical protein [Corallococcus exercitus]